MFEKYWRTIILSKIEWKPGCFEYKITYLNQLLFDKKPTRELYDTTREVVKRLTQLPHKYRAYLGFSDEEKAGLEHVIDSTIERRRLLGVK